MDQRIAFCETNTWQGLSIGAVHYYGTLRYYDLDGEAQWVEILRALQSQSEVDSYNSSYDTATYDVHKIGDEVEGWRNETSIWSKAKEIWRDIAPHCLVLHAGRASVAEPQQVLSPHGNFQRYTQRVMLKCGMLNWHDGTDEQWSMVQNLSREWDVNLDTLIAHLEMYGWGPTIDIPLETTVFDRVLIQPKKLRHVSY